MPVAVTPTTSETPVSLESPEGLKILEEITSLVKAKVNGLTNGHAEVAEMPAEEEQSSKSDSSEEKTDEEKEKEDDEPKFKPGCRSEFKRVDEFYNKETGEWQVRESASLPEDKEDKFREYCFTYYRRFNSQGTSSTITVDIKSQYLKDVGKEVIGNIPGLSWNPRIVEVEPQILMAWLPKLDEHLATLRLNTTPTEDQQLTITHLSLLLSFMKSEYSETLEQVAGLVPSGDITFELLWALLLPRSLLYTTCPVTAQPRAVRLVGAELQSPWGEPPFWQLDCEYVDAVAAQSEDAARFGLAQLVVKILAFKGVAKITGLAAYPMKFHAREDEVKAKLVARGKRWMELDGMHHMQYQAFAYRFVQGKYARVSVKGRIMIDKSTFRRINPNYPMAAIKGAGEDNSYRSDDSDDEVGSKRERDEFLATNTLDESQLLLTTPILYGFSLTQKFWVQFNVEDVTPIVWNDAAFQNLVLPPAQKLLIQSLVEAHSSKETQFDDFIEGKGQGLIFNLFGPPGIGKTMSAEATSEHVRKPLYMVGAGDLGIDAESLDAALTQTFDIAHTWGAVVLLDEADVYLEARSIHDLARNALVAVFLRQLEYFRGILFLTTNRVKEFDEAFQSRIHISLRFRDLDSVAKRQIWCAFLTKVGVAEGELTEEEWRTLAEKKINGRQIKNCVRTAKALSVSTGEKMGYCHVEQVLGVMEQFELDFKQLA